MIFLSLEKTNKECILCGHRALKYWCRVGKLNIYRCKRCDIRFVNPQPDDEFLIKFYNPGLRRWIDSKKYKKLRKKHFLFYRHLLKKNITSTKRLLDFGCGIGYFLEIMQKLQWETVGIDISESDIKKAKQNKLRVFHLNEVFKIKENYFSVCTMLDFLEHVKNPLYYVKIAYEKLLPGGLILIDTGNVGGLASLIGKSNNPFLKNEGHIVFFTKKSIKFLLEKGGFKILEILDERAIKRISRKKSFFNFNKFFLNIKNLFKFVITNPNMIILARKNERENYF